MRLTTLLCLLLTSCDDPAKVACICDSALDLGAADARLPDGATPDAGPLDGAMRLDGGPRDAAQLPDGAAQPDLGAPDAQPRDAALPDADEVDASADPPDLSAPADQGAVDMAVEPPPPNHGLDQFEYRCMTPGWRPGVCAPGLGEFHDGMGNQQHIAPELVIPPYPTSPPSSGAHRGQWGRWGEYISLPPQRWLHNLEHGGIAVLYHPCAPPELIQGLRDLVHARPEGETLQWIMTPYPDMDAAVALVAWEWTYLSNCIQPDELNLFFDRFHAMGPEAVAADGAYSEGWIGR